jgi:hypothetical protein
MGKDTRDSLGLRDQSGRKGMGPSIRSHLRLIIVTGNLSESVEAANS